jgi:hypothetical protein
VFEFADKYHIPHDAALGGAETMYPDYLLKMKAKAPPSASASAK